MTSYRWGRFSTMPKPLTRVAGIALAATALHLSGCAGDKPFATINGQVVTQDEYVKMLERQNVLVPGGQSTNAERLVIDQLISNKVILAQAAKDNVVPTDDEVNRFYTLQKKLVEAQFPGKTYENALKEQGITEEEIKSDIKVKLAETNIYSSKLKISQETVRKIYDQNRNQIGVPARVQLRMIVVGPNTPDFAKAKQLFAQGKPFDDVAKEVNIPQLKASSGLIQQAKPYNQLDATYRAQVEQSADGKFFGPLDIRLSADPNSPTAKAWIKVEKKMPALSFSFDDAAQLIRQQLVQQAVTQPANAAVRNGIIQQKLDAKFEPSGADHAPVWESLRKSAVDAGIGQTAPVGGATAPAGGAGIPSLGTAK